MAVKRGIYGASENYDVQIVTDFPKDKIILALDNMRAIAFLIMPDYDHQDKMKTSDEKDRYIGVPISSFDNMERVTNLEGTAEDLMNREDTEIIFLDNMGDFAKVKDAWVYA